MVTPETTTLSNHQQYADALIDLLGYAQREVELFTPELIAVVYERPRLVDAARDFALRNKVSRLRILMRSTDTAIREGRRLIDLARRVSSSISIRRLADDFQDRGDAFATADGRIFALRRQASTWDGIYDHSRPEIARQLTQDFNEMWEHSEADPQLRQLYI